MLENLNGGRSKKGIDAAFCACPANDEASSNALQRDRETRVEEGKRCFFVSVSGRNLRQVTCSAEKRT
jgi:hypothetical protein